MSSSQVSRVRRNGSPPPQQPGRKHQPLRATVPFQLLGATATRGPAPASSPAPAAAAAQGCPHNNGGAAAVAVAAAAASAASTAVATTPATVASAVVAVVVAASSHVPVPGFGSGYGGAAQAGDAGSTATAAAATKQAASPERRSPASPGCKAAAAGGAAGERQRVARTSSSSPSVGGPARRAAAGGGGGCPAPLDAIAGAYLTGQWPRDHHHHPHPAAPAVRDKATQTPRAWADESWDPHRRAPLWESSEQRKEIAKLRQQLQRSKQSGLEREAVSPLLAGLAGLTGLTAPPPPPTVGAQPLVAMPKPVAVALAGFPSMPGGSGGGAATAPTLGKGVLPRLRASVEALNQEIERVFVQEAWCHDSPRQDAPDGRRAPLPTRPCSSNSGIGGGSSGSSGSGGGSNTATRSVDTQTPSALDGERCRSLPASPALLPPLPPAAATAAALHHHNHHHQQQQQHSNHLAERSPPPPPPPLVHGAAALPAPVTVKQQQLQQLLAQVVMSSTSSSTLTALAAVDDVNREGGGGGPEGRGGSPLPKYVSSPKPNHSYTFMREPPEGCERVTAFEETQQHKEIPSIFCPDKNKVNFVIKSDTAFCPISLLRPPPRILHFTPEPAAQGSAQDAGQGSAGDAPEEMESPSCMLRQRSADR